MRAEQVTLSKEVVVRERVVVHRRRIEEMARIEADLRREELRTTKQGHAEVAEMRGTALRGERSDRGV